MVSLLAVSALAVSGFMLDEVSFIVVVVSVLVVDFSELQPAAIDPIIVATRAKLKIFFFISICFKMHNY